MTDIHWPGNNCMLPPHKINTWKIWPNPFIPQVFLWHECANTWICPFPSIRHDVNVTLGHMQQESEGWFLSKTQNWRLLFNEKEYPHIYQTSGDLLATGESYLFPHWPGKNNTLMVTNRNTLTSKLQARLSSCDCVPHILHSKVSHNRQKSHLVLT